MTFIFEHKQLCGSVMVCDFFSAVLYSPNWRSKEIHGILTPDNCTLVKTLGGENLGGKHVQVPTSSEEMDKRQRTLRLPQLGPG